MARFVDSVPYLVMRGGRPRWEPGPRLRPHFKGQDLKTLAGQWMSQAEATVRARELNDEVTEWRAGGKAPRRKKVPRKVPRSCRALFEAWTASPEFEMLAPKTQVDYRMKAEIFLSSEIAPGDARFEVVPVAALGKAAMKTYWREAYRARGHHMANGIIAVVRAMLTHAEGLEWITANPAFRLKLKTPPPRLVIWLPKEIDAFLTTADALKLPSIGDAVVVALHSGQRMSDVLALPERLFADDRIKLSQSKRKALVDAPMTPQCKARVAAIRHRRRQAAIVDFNGPLIQREDGGAYTKDSFYSAFAKVRAAAAGEMPSLAGRRFQDLRDTAVTRLALADCSLPQIAAITGHSLQSITQIMKHYLALQPEMADAAIAKLTTWLIQQEIAI